MQFLLFAAALSLTSPGDYYYTHPTNVPASAIVGLGIGPGGDYRMLRAEDLAFLHEAYVERCDVDFARYGSAPTVEGVDTLGVVNVFSRPHAPSWIFDVPEMASCFPLSCYPEWNSVFPYAFIADPLGSHVSSDFEFRQMAHLEAVTGSVWQVDGRSNLRYVGGNVDWPDGAGLISTNVFAYWTGGSQADRPGPANWMRRVPSFAVVKNLYGALDAFDYAVEERSAVVITNLQYVYHYIRNNKAPAEFSYSTYTRPDGVDGTYASGVTSWTTNVVDGLVGENATVISSGITEYKEKTQEYNRDSYIVGMSPGAVQRHYVYFDEYVSEETVNMFHSASNHLIALGFTSPVTTNSPTQVEILGVVLHAKVQRGRRAFVQTYMGDGSSTSVQTNSSDRGMMVLNLGMPTLVPGKYSGGRQVYMVPWPVEYLKSRADALFGDIAAERAPDLTVHPPEDGSLGEYRKRWYCGYTTSFTSSGLYVFYRRIFRARLL